MYVTIHRRFEPTIRVSYSKTETARTVDEVHHDLVREAMRLTEIDEPLEITTRPASPGVSAALAQAVPPILAPASANGCWKRRRKCGRSCVPR